MNRRILAAALSAMVLISMMHIVAAEDDEGGRSGGDSGDRTSTVTVVREIQSSGTDPKVLAALDLLTNETIDLKVENAQQNATINYLLAQIAAMKADQDSRQAQLQSQISYQNATIAFLLSQAARPTAAAPAVDLSAIDTTVSLDNAAANQSDVSAPAASPQQERPLILRILGLFGVV